MDFSPLIVGIVNVTPDSFSDGGRFLDPEHAAAHAKQLAADGADIVELGAASSHPSAPHVSAAEELRRLAPVLERLSEHSLRLCVDSSQPETQRFALARGVSMLNDVTGFADPSAYPALAASDCTLVVMHALPPRASAPLDDALLRHIEKFFEQRTATLTRAGISRTRLVLDPGMGLFLGPSPEASLYVLRHLDKLHRRLGYPMLVGISRKSFLGALTGRAAAERGAASLAAELDAATRGVDYIRTHDVRALGDGLRVMRALRCGSSA